MDKFAKSTIAAAIVLLLECLSEAAAAQPSNLSKFKAEMQPYYEIVEQANLARTCSLRSEHWFETILNGYMLAQIKMENKYGVSVDSANAASKQANNDFESHQSLPDACGRLMHSPTMSKLDAYESGLTGGYH